jgi:hypothetical protein
LESQRPKEYGEKREEERRSLEFRIEGLYVQLDLNGAS